jgi:hypothetical protein
VTTNDTAQWSTIVHLATPTISFTDFSGAAGLLTLNGSTSLATPNLQLTPEATRQSGSAYFDNLQPVKNGFITTFTYNITDPNQVGGLYPADGLTFAIQNAVAGLGALGGPGGNLGYGPSAGASGAIDNSLVVEFDTYFNDWDPNGNHIAVQSCGPGLGNSPAHSASNSENYPDCHLAINPSISTLLGQHTVTVAYNATLHTLNVQLDSAQVLSLSNFHVENYVNLAGPSLDSAYVGFTAGTGDLEEQVNVLNWAFAPTM